MLWVLPIWRSLVSVGPFSAVLKPSTLLFCKDRPLPELLAPHFPNAEDLRAIVDAARATADLGKVRHRIGSVNLVAHSC